MRKTKRFCAAPVAASVVVVLCACGGDDGARSALGGPPQIEEQTESPAHSINAMPEAVAEPAPAGPQVLGAERRAGARPVGELLATLGDRDAQHGWAPDPPPTALPRAIADCDPEEWFCRVQEVAAFEAPRAVIVLSADVEESGHATIFVVRDDGSQEETLRAFGTYGTNQATLRRRLRPYARLPTLPNLITARSLEEFSVNSYPVMARVSGPLDGWVVWLETTGIEDRAQRLHLMRPDGSGDRVLATRPAEVGPCTADGYWCEVNNRDPDADCTDAVLEAEGGLCSMPSSLYEVGSDPHFARAGSSMKVDAQAVMYSLVDAPLTTVTRTSAQPWPTTVPATSTCPSFVPWSRGMTA